MDSIKKLQHKNVPNTFDDYIVFIFDMDDKLGISEMYFYKYIKDALRWSLIDLTHLWTLIIDNEIALYIKISHK